VSGIIRPAADNVVAVIVTLHPKRDVSEHVQTLIGHVLRVVVVDNGSGSGAASILDSIAALPSVDVIRNPVNLGIAHALNQGARAAIDAGADWLLTLDQDAEPSHEIVRVAGRTFEAYPHSERVAVVGSMSFEDYAIIQGRSKGEHGRKRPWMKASATITAGSFISLVAFQEVGGFLDDLFIDMVDTEFCLRARSRGYRVVQSWTPAMTHRIGQPTERWIGFRTVHPSNHSALRRYYITRNRLLVWRRYWRIDPRAAAKEMVEAEKELLKLLLVERDRGEKVRAILAGLRDGLRGVAGERGGHANKKLHWPDPRGPLTSADGCVLDQRQP
jgi:rhamnosyltransferase